MNRMKLFVITLLAIAPLCLIAQNHMDLILSIQGHHPNSMSSIKMASADFNADGYDDLLIPQFRSTPLAYPALLNCYYGGPNFDSVPDLVCQHEFWDQVPGEDILSGDFNGDGYDDIVDCTLISETPPQEGIRFFYGGPNPDFIPDHIMPLAQFDYHHPQELRIQANIGDINNDGCDDVAFCSPQSYSGTPDYHGWVHVYADNILLADTTVANEDNVQEHENVRFSISPNPNSRKQQDWNYLLEGGELKSNMKCRIDIYNIKGQLIASQMLSPGSNTKGKLPKMSLTSGVYLASFVADGATIARTKFSIIR